MKQQKSLKPYAKPTITQVQLVPEEAVLGGCKADPNPGGPGSTPCSGITGTCSANGT